MLSVLTARADVICLVLALIAASCYRSSGSTSTSEQRRGTLLGEEGETVRSQSDPDLEAAYITVLAIRAVMPSGAVARSDRIAIFPKSNVLSPDDAARVLASVEKPIQCTGQVTEGVLSIVCQSPPDSGQRDLLWHHRQQVRAGVGLISLIRQRFGAAFGVEPKLLLKAGSQSRLVTLSGLERWYQDYLITLPLALGVTEAAPEEIEQGASAVLIASRHDPVDSPF